MVKNKNLHWTQRPENKDKLAKLGHARWKKATKHVDDLVLKPEPTEEIPDPNQSKLELVRDYNELVQKIKDQIINIDETIKGLEIERAELQNLLTNENS